MFRKIHSNRDPQATVFSELRREFRPYLRAGQRRLRRFAGNYPRFLFGMMVINLTLSAVLVLTVFRRKDNAKHTHTVSAAAPISDGFDRIHAAGLALRETIRLKREIDSLTQLTALSRKDTIRLSSDLDSLRHIRLNLNP